MTIMMMVTVTVMMIMSRMMMMMHALRSFSEDPPLFRGTEARCHAWASSGNPGMMMTPETRRLGVLGWVGGLGVGWLGCVLGGECRGVRSFRVCERRKMKNINTHKTHPKMEKQRKITPNGKMKTENQKHEKIKTREMEKMRTSTHERKN